jgi:hypothetical protein
MATAISVIVSEARKTLLEPAEVAGGFWTDAELVAIVNKGIKDLWRAINNQYQDYFLTINETVALAANGTALTSVPDDCSVVRGLEQKDLSTYPNLVFDFCAWNDPKFQSARASQAFDPALGGTVLWCVIGAGAPVAAPTIRVAPAVSTALTIRLSYIPVVPTVVAGDNNPIPGESDDALIAWLIAHAISKDTEGQMPNVAWLAKYKTEKENILVSLAPRQQDSQQVVEDVFAAYSNGS